MITEADAARSFTHNRPEPATNPPGVRMMTNTPPPKPVTDISERGAAIGRIVDRLPPGHFVMSIVKPETGPLHVLVTQQDGAAVMVIRDIEIRR